MAKKSKIKTRRKSKRGGASKISKIHTTIHTTQKSSTTRPAGKLPRIFHTLAKSVRNLLPNLETTTHTIPVRVPKGITLKYKNGNVQVKRGEEELRHFGINTDNPKAYVKDQIETVLRQSYYKSNINSTEQIKFEYTVLE